MADIVSPIIRSQMMSRIRATDTKAEMAVRRGLHRLGFRPKLHDTKLPGKPDLVFPKYKAIILVHGCFWHVHECKYFKWPKTRSEFWREKLSRNRIRDNRLLAEYSALGWHTLVVWECAIKVYGEDEVVEYCAKWLAALDGQATTHSSFPPVRND